MIRVQNFVFLGQSVTLVPAKNSHLKVMWVWSHGSAKIFHYMVPPKRKSKKKEQVF